ncbi:MAG: hypothetical protein ACLQJR_35510 [Stellaceae bacterium]
MLPVAAVAGGATGQIFLSGIVGPAVNTRPITQTATAEGTAMAIGCNFAAPLRVSLERGRFEPAPAEPAGAGPDPRPHFVMTWRSTARQEFSCQAPGQELIVPIPTVSTGESVTAKISIN